MLPAIQHAFNRSYCQQIYSKVVQWITQQFSMKINSIFWWRRRHLLTNYEASVQLIQLRLALRVRVWVAKRKIVYSIALIRKAIGKWESKLTINCLKETNEYYKLTEIYYKHSHWSIAWHVLMRVCKHSCDILDLRIFLRTFFMNKAIEYFLSNANPELHLGFA